MHLEIKKTGFSANAVEAVLSHKGVEIYWPIVAVREPTRRFEEESDSDVDDFEIFSYLNQYWASLPADTIEAIFACYRKINDHINNVISVHELDHSLRPLVAELLSYHDLNQIENWMMLKSDIQIPFSLPDTFSGEGRSMGTVEKTYIKADYIKLVAMTLGLKAMLPVWINYIEWTKSAAGQTWKEYNAFKLITRSQYYRCEAMQRLRVYIEASIDTPDNLASAIVEGISSEDFPEWLMAITIIRKIVITDIRGIPRSKTITAPVLMSAIHKYVTGKIKRYDASFIGTVSPKKTESDVGDGENNISRLENFKARESIAAGDIVGIEVFFEDPMNTPYIFQTVVNDAIVPSKFAGIRDVLPVFMQAMDAYNQIDQTTGSIPTIKQWQRAITEWVLRGLLPTRSLSVLTKPVVLNTIAITAAYLWKAGFKDLALLITSTDKHEEQLNRPDVEKVSRDNLATLDVLYPHQLKGLKKNEKSRNAAVATIDLIVRDIVEHVRYATIPQEMQEEVLPGQTRRRVVIQRNLRDRLAQLIVHLKTTN